VGRRGYFLATHSDGIRTRKANVQTRFEVARDVILEAGTLANGYFNRIGSLTVKSKGLHDLVSEADVNTELLIRNSFERAFPEDAFFGEESEHNLVHAEHGLWVVDPIDGTQPFLSGLPNWSISIAYVLNGSLEFGLVYNPPCGELFVGGKDVPATVNGRPITTHVATDLSEGLVSIGFSPRSSSSLLINSLTKLLEQKGMLFRNGSGALSLAYVAAGRLLGHIEPHMHSWDCLGAIAIIEAAGGRVNEFLVGDALIKGNRVVAGSPALFGQLQLLLE
jgi:myo-inositol-1(or 4)-monophosphatase